MDWALIINYAWGHTMPIVWVRHIWYLPKFICLISTKFYNFYEKFALKKSHMSPIYSNKSQVNTPETIQTTANLGDPIWIGAHTLTLSQYQK